MKFFLCFVLQRNFNLKEHISKPYIFTAWQWKLLIFQTLNFVSSFITSSSSSIQSYSSSSGSSSSSSGSSNSSSESLFLNSGSSFNASGRCLSPLDASSISLFLLFSSWSWSWYFFNLGGFFSWNLVNYIYTFMGLGLLIIILITLWLDYPLIPCNPDPLSWT